MIDLICRPRATRTMVGAIMAFITIGAAAAPPKHTGRAVGARSDAVAIKTLSNRADLISDGDALVEVTVPEDATAVVIKLNNGDVSRSFERKSRGRFVGLLTALIDGSNDVTAEVSGFRRARLKIINHPRSGTVFSGPFPATFYCATPTPQPARGMVPATNASGLSAPPDKNCNVAAEFKLYYRSTASDCSMALPDPSPVVPADATVLPAPPAPPAKSCFKVFDPLSARPADLATTTTDNGLIVPYIVRVERGVINRGIYDVSVLFNPARPWTAVHPQPQWNGKVYYQLGPGTSNPLRQFRPMMPWTFDQALSKGYAVVENSMSDSGSNSNRMLSAETMMMTKEHIGDRYGPIFYTVASGCSGGSINAHTAMSLMPGLIDGVITSCSLIDTESVAEELSDCALLVEAYNKPEWLKFVTTGNNGAAYSQKQINAIKAAIEGHPDQTACQAWFSLTGRGAANMNAGNYLPRIVQPADSDTGRITQLETAQNNCQLPAPAIYDPKSNPSGVRCTPWDWAVNTFGKTPDGKRALQTRDNVGVQYGLRALLDGTINGEAFVTLNEVIGGVDKDGQPTAARSTGDIDAVRAAYLTGLVVNGKSLANYPEIDLRGFDDSVINAFPGARVSGVHLIWRSFSLRDRLDRDSGGHGNLAMWRFGETGLLTPPQLAAGSFAVMDVWLTALKRDSSDRPLAQKVLTAKPSSAADFCILSSDPGQTTRVTDSTSCDSDRLLKPSSSPRQVAGGPRTEDILKCQLRPLRLAGYGGRITAHQLARLVALFKSGVCDWSKPSVGFSLQSPTPLSFVSGRGMLPLPPPPQSTRF